MEGALKLLLLGDALAGDLLDDLIEQVGGRAVPATDKDIRVPIGHFAAAVEDGEGADIPLAEFLVALQETGGDAACGRAGGKAGKQLADELAGALFLEEEGVPISVAVFRFMTADEDILPLLDLLLEGDLGMQGGDLGAGSAQSGVQGLTVEALHDRVLDPADGEQRGE